MKYCYGHAPPPLAVSPPNSPGFHRATTADDGHGPDESTEKKLLSEVADNDRDTKQASDALDAEEQRLAMAESGEMGSETPEAKVETEERLGVALGLKSGPQFFFARLTSAGSKAFGLSLRSVTLALCLLLGLLLL